MDASDSTLELDSKLRLRGASCVSRDRKPNKSYNGYTMMIFIVRDKKRKVRNWRWSSFNIENMGSAMNHHTYQTAPTELAERTVYAVGWQSSRYVV